MVANAADNSAGQWTPVLSAGSGTLTAATVVASNYRRHDFNMVYFELRIDITTNGSAAGYVQATLPFPAAGIAVFAGRSLSGKMLQGQVVAGSTAFGIVNYDNTYPGADGASLSMSGWYRAASEGP